MKRDFHLTMREVIAKHTHEKSQNTIDKLMKMARKSPYPQDLTVVPAQAQEIVLKLSLTYQLGLVTGRIKSGIKAFYDVFGCQDNFSVVVDADDYTHPKPHPEPLIIACQKLKLDPHQTVYIGDMPTDIQAAYAAGMKVILYETFNHYAGADYYFKSFKQFLEPHLRKLVT